MPCNYDEIVLKEVYRKVRLPRFTVGRCKMGELAQSLPQRINCCQSLRRDTCGGQDYRTAKPVMVTAEPNMGADRAIAHRSQWIGTACFKKRHLSENAVELLDGSLRVAGTI
jgi:hypothetical protein